MVSPLVVQDILKVHDKVRWIVWSKDDSDIKKICARRSACEVEFEWIDDEVPIGSHELRGVYVVE